MTDEADALFSAMFALEDVRELLRETAPKHRLSEEQKKAYKEALDKAKAAIAKLEALR